MKTAKLLREVTNFRPSLQVKITLQDAAGRRKTERAYQIFNNPHLMEQLNQEDSNRVSFLAAMELMN